MFCGWIRQKLQSFQNQKGTDNTNTSLLVWSMVEVASWFGPTFIVGLYTIEGTTDHHYAKGFYSKRKKEKTLTEVV